MGTSWTARDDDALLERVQQLRPVADELGITIAQLALAWVLREPNVASAIVGASRPEQVEDNAAAFGVELGEETLKRIDEILADSVVYEGAARRRLATSMERDVAVVLSGGAVNGVLMELGFLQAAARDATLWPRIGWIYGTSSGALAGTMAALDRLDDLEDVHARAAAGGAHSGRTRSGGCRCSARTTTACRRRSASGSATSRRSRASSRRRRSRSWCSRRT